MISTTLSSIVVSPADVAAAATTTMHPTMMSSILNQTTLLAAGSIPAHSVQEQMIAILTGLFYGKVCAECAQEREKNYTSFLNASQKRIILAN